MKGFEDHLALIFTKGIFEICQFEDESEVKTYLNPEATNHDGEILSFDYDQLNKLILTAGTDNKIKIWSYYKVAIYEINLDVGLNYAFWT
jgi:hypothetical protein